MVKLSSNKKIDVIINCVYICCVKTIGKNKFSSVFSIILFTEENILNKTKVCGKHVNEIIMPLCQTLTSNVYILGLCIINL
jgi:hypothetical protein